MLPHNMMGLTDEQVEELKLKDEWGEKCVPTGGWTFNKDVIGTWNHIKKREMEREEEREREKESSISCTGCPERILSCVQKLVEIMK